MAEVKKQMIACPKCGREIEIGVWDSIDIPYDMEQKEKVMKNTFFKVACDSCKITFPIGYKCLYNDMEQKYLIWLAPKLEEEEMKDIEDYNERLKTDNRLRLAQGGYKYRIVRNDNELREKVLIFDEGLDDRYIETMKMVYVPILKKNLARDSKVMGLYFDRKEEEDGYQWVVVFDNRPPIVAEINMEIYEDMKEKLSGIVEEKTAEGFIQIHAPWAMEVMMSRVDGVTPPVQ
ncbi:MAG: CpXC domain-containing protein [Bacteroidales bacterium]|nr:CpXC domain-containing protein [Clostridium sp.]MCM1204755.1 CpXC domain-containing protein [Bacteroidales bacterium]